LTLASDGTISGSPTGAGTFFFTAQVQSGDGQTAQKGFSITVYFGLGITTSSLPNGQVGVAYSQSLAATGGDGSYTWSVIAGALPDGLSLDSNTGVISGNPTSAGTWNFTVQVASGDGQTATKALSIQISVVPDP
jgi:hypothetical protein